ncbi:metallophosphoesterase family protein [Siminovitchia sediminis]|uniref:Phosphoesterase n=1 Tax=Siminovitchia sediminis TaxID=1274353 RepID=A0ABW4KIE2_9BACI
MRLAFISDIHGNSIALDAVLNDISKRKVDQIYVLGDICYRGPEPKQSVNLVQSISTKVIKGNADEWLVRGIKKGEVPEASFEIMEKERKWTLSQLEEKDIRYLDNLPSEIIEQAGNFRIHAFHAAPHSTFDVIQPYENDEVISKKLFVNEADVYIYGHIHKPYVRYINGKCVVNIGSVGLPFDGIAKPSYAILDIDGTSFHVSIVRVGYEVQRVVNQIKQFDYPNTEFMISLLEKGST